jgi:hypothetical protein
MASSSGGKKSRTARHMTTLEGRCYGTPALNALQTHNAGAGASAYWLAAISAPGALWLMLLGDLRSLPYDFTTGLMSLALDNTIPLFSRSLGSLSPPSLNHNRGQDHGRNGRELSVAAS